MRHAKLRQFAKQVEKKYGKVVEIGVQTMDIPRLQTGSMSLDLALGGGVPVGRVTMLYGQKSSGKTTTTYRIAANQQNKCANCLRVVADYAVVEMATDDGDTEYVATGTCDCYSKGLFKPIKYPDEKVQEYKDRIKGYEINSYEPFTIALVDIEGAFDPVWAQKLGLDDRTIVYVRPDTAEEAIDVYDSLMRTGAVDMFILDSIAAMTPSKEVEESVEKWQQGLQARLVNKFCRKVQSTANAISRDYGRQVTQLWINQIRMKIGVMFGNPETVPGGMGQGFVTSVEIKLWANDFNKESDQMAGRDHMERATSVRINFRTEKNKVAPPKRTGSYVMDLESGGVDDSALIYSLAERLGEIRKDGTKWILGANEFKTKKAMVEHLNTVDRNRVVDLILKRMG